MVSANDQDAICGALNEARKAGAKVVTFDSDTNPTCRDLFINQATAEGIAKIQIKLISEAIGADGGEIAILSATPNATNQNAWIEMMKTELAKPEYTKLKLVDTVYGDDDDQKSFPEAQGLLAKYPNLKGIISPTTVGIAAAGRYLSGSTYKGKVQLTGLGTPNQMRDYVKDGTVKAFALWNPADLGYLAAYAGARAGLRADHRQGGRQVQGRQARRVHRRQGRHRAARRPVHVQRRQHRPVQLLTHELPGGHAIAGLGDCHQQGRDRAPRLLHPAGRPGPAGRVPAAGTPRCGRRCWPRCATPAGTTTRSSCATTACWWATSLTDDLGRGPGGDGGHRGQRAGGRPRWRRSSSTCRAAARTAACPSSTRCSTSTPSSAGAAHGETRRTSARRRRQTLTDSPPRPASRVLAALRAQRIETPSWAYGNSGTRFKVFAQEGVPRDPYEKIADAATVHRFTGVAPSVALHIPWDTGRRLRRAGRVRRRPGRRARHDQLQRVPGQRLQARQRHQPRPGRAAQGDRPPARVRRHHGPRPGRAT